MSLSFSGKNFWMDVYDKFDKKEKMPGVSWSDRSKIHLPERQWEQTGVTHEGGRK
jgi:hypothetical protein